MNDWKNYKWLVVFTYFLLAFSALLWLLVMDIFTTILLLFVAVLAFTARKQYKRAVQQNNPTTDLTQVNPAIPNELINRDEKTPHNRPTQIEQRIIELVNENPDLTEDEIKEVILKEEKEKILNQVTGNIKFEVGRGSTPKENKTNSLPQFEDADLSYSKIRKLTPNFVALDFETTGLSHFENEIIQIAAVRYVNFKEVDKYVTFVKPSKPIPPRITQINGISNNDVKNAPTIQSALIALVDFIKDDVLIAHNAPFDMKFLLANIYKEGFEYKKFRVIDTLPLARKHIHSTDNHKLPTLKAFLKLDQFKSHEALHDCYVTAEVYKYCYEESLVK